MPGRTHIRPYKPHTILNLSLWIGRCRWQSWLTRHGSEETAVDRTLINSLTWNHISRAGISLRKLEDSYWHQKTGNWQKCWAENTIGMNFYTLFLRVGNKRTKIIWKIFAIHKTLFKCPYSNLCLYPLKIQNCKDILLWDFIWILSQRQTMKIGGWFSTDHNIWGLKYHNASSSLTKGKIPSERKLGKNMINYSLSLLKKFNKRRKPVQ